MLKRKWLWLVCFIVLLTACSNANENSTQESSDFSAEQGENAKISQDSADHSATESIESSQEEQPSVGAVKQASKANLTNQEDKMIIYNGDLTVKTKDYEEFYQELEQLIQDKNGYMVHTSTHQNEQEQMQATITLRVPKEQFYPFVHSVPSISDEISHSNINGEDVTEQYVDLESRLKAKEKIEERLLSFMDKAEKTEDLIAISKDLERVQEEIETIQGRMKYLQNQSDFSTLTLNIQETKVTVSGSNRDDLQTWVKTKQALQNSWNGILAFFSFIFVAVIGYSPVLAPILLLTVLAVFYLRKRKSSPKNDGE